MRIRILILVLSLLLTGVSFAAPSPIEKEVFQYVNSQRAAQLALLEKLVNINSGTNNPKGVHRVGEMLVPQLSALGFKTRWVEEPASMHRAGTLVAERLVSKPEKSLLLIGHLDTVFPATSSFQGFKRQGTQAKGPGVIDDKGGIVVLLYALKALEAEKALDKFTIRVVLTGDEEDAGKPTRISREPLFAAAKKSDLGLDFEWALTQDSATIARRGIFLWTLTTMGKEAHSSEIFQPEVGAGAIFDLSYLLENLRENFQGEKNLSFNVGSLLGGTALDFDPEKAEGKVSGKANVVAQQALAYGDLRFLTKDQEITAKGRMQIVITDNLPATRAAIHFQDGIPAMPPTVANKKLLAIFSQVSEDLGYGTVSAVDPGKRGAGDISHVAGMLSASLAGLGPVGSGAHSVEETLDVNSLPMQTARVAVFMLRLGKER